MNDVQMLTSYNEVTQEEFEAYENIAENILTWEFVWQTEMKEALAFYVLKSYLLEMKLI